MITRNYISKKTLGTSPKSCGYCQTHIWEKKRGMWIGIHLTSGVTSLYMFQTSMQHLQQYFNWNITTIHKQISHKGSIFHYQRVDAPFVQPNAILTVYLMGCTFSHKFVGTALQDLFVEAAKEKRCLADCLWWRIQDAGCSGTWGAITWVWYLHYLHLSIYLSIYLSI